MIQIIPNKNLVFLEENKPISVDCSSLSDVEFVGIEGKNKWVEYKPFTGRVTEYDWGEVEVILQEAEDIANTPPPELTQEEILQQFMDQIENWMDQVAAERGYKSMERLCTYVGDPNTLWDAEGQAGLTFRSAVWVKAIEIENDVLAGTRPIPTIEEVLAEMPTINWP